MMINVSEISPLTAFLRNHKEYIERLHASKRPEVLPVNGRPSVIVQDAEAYQKLLDMVEEIESEAIIREGLAEIERGEEGIPAQEVLADIRRLIDEHKSK